MNIDGKQRIFLHQKENSQPCWNGTDSLNDKIILIHGEQGLGDNIHFVRYFNLIESKAKKAILQVDKKLVQLFKDSDPNINIFSYNEKLPIFDIHCPYFLYHINFLLQ